MAALSEQMLGVLRDAQNDPAAGLKRCHGGFWVPASGRDWQRGDPSVSTHTIKALLRRDLLEEADHRSNASGRFCVQVRITPAGRAALAEANPKELSS